MPLYRFTTESDVQTFECADADAAIQRGSSMVPIEICEIVGVHQELENDGGTSWGFFDDTITVEKVA